MTTRKKNTPKHPLANNLEAMEIAYQLDNQLQKMNIRNLDIAKNQYANALFFKTIKEEKVFYFNGVKLIGNDIDVKSTFTSTIKNWDHYCQETFNQTAEAIDLEIANIENLVLQIKELFSVIYFFDELKKCKKENVFFRQCLSESSYPLTSQDEK